MSDLEILPGNPDHDTIIERERPDGMIAGVKPQWANAALILMHPDEPWGWRESW